MLLTMNSYFQSFIFLNIALLTATSMTDALTCFPLTGSLSCAPFNQMLIQPLAGAFTDVKSFDVYMTSMLDNNSSYISDYQQRYGCPGYKGQGQRFHMVHTSFIKASSIIFHHHLFASSLIVSSSH